MTATDSLDAGPEGSPPDPTTAVALRSAEAGADLLLVTAGSTSKRVFGG